MYADVGVVNTTATAGVHKDKPRDGNSRGQGLCVLCLCSLLSTTLSDPCL